MMEELTWLQTSHSRQTRYKVLMVTLLMIKKLYYNFIEKKERLDLKRKQNVAGYMILYKMKKFVKKLGKTQKGRRNKLYLMSIKF